MTNGLYSGVAAMASNQRRLDSIAQNLANLTTTGYKSRRAFVEAFDEARGGVSRRQTGVRTRIDFAQGGLIDTGNPLHLALHGEGFFAAESPEGEVYTRNGELRLTDAGVLTTYHGYPLAWETAGGTIDPLGEAIVVDGAGNVRQGATDVGRLRLVDFEDTGPLRQDTEGYFHAPPSLREKAAAPEVRQGALEGANTSAIDEMVAMIRVQRQFESASNVVGMIADSYRRLNRQQQ